MKSLLRRPSGVPALAVVLLCAGATACSSPDGRMALTPPSPPAKQAALCRALHQELPRTLAGKPLRDTEPASELTAAWGDDPAVTLRCGVPRPKLLDHRPPPDGMYIDDVGWLPEKQPDGSVRCTTVLREAYVEVTLPKEVAGAAGDVSALTGLAGAVKKTVPEGYVR
ncbi:hypothetical protein GCM10010218_33700 [Streptomyces mashuensis]|uniref:DUF3515 domain-containing protein n=1 Tax=Streptomyces mashuensis TaxID=33904 RepID=A0A919B3C3_9ACTN|nr:DUF3515 domain-containing protein [Streptomyces mashuensis]GHF49611.1 hypothetical protein GCM10010218_33700 [Streptomyces mashuensis]